MERLQRAPLPVVSHALLRPKKQLEAAATRSAVACSAVARSAVARSAVACSAARFLHTAFELV